MTVFKVAGQVVGFDEHGNLTLNGKPPAQMIEIGMGWYKVVGYFFRHVTPKKVKGARKRKQALKASAKKYRFSFKIQRTM